MTAKKVVSPPQVQRQEEEAGIMRQTGGSGTVAVGAGAGTWMSHGTGKKGCKDRMGIWVDKEEIGW